MKANLRDFAVSGPDHRNKASCHLFARGGSYLQFVKHTTSVKCNESKAQ